MDKSQRKTLVKAVCLLFSGAMIGIAVMMAVQHGSDRKNVALAERPSAGQHSDSSPSSASPATTYGAAIPSGATYPAATTNSWSQPMPTPPDPTPAPSNDPPPGRYVEYTQNSSGYTIYTGRKAVDSLQTVNLGSGAAVVTDQYGNVTDLNPQPIGRNGLRGNPCVDPPSTFGASYGRNGR